MAYGKNNSDIPFIIPFEEIPQKHIHVDDVVNVTLTLRFDTLAAKDLLSRPKINLFDILKYTGSVFVYVNKVGFSVVAKRVEDSSIVTGYNDNNQGYYTEDLKSAAEKEKTPGLYTNIYRNLSSLLDVMNESNTNIVGNRMSVAWLNITRTVDINNLPATLEEFLDLEAFIITMRPFLVRSSYEWQVTAMRYISFVYKLVKSGAMVSDKSIVGTINAMKTTNYPQNAMFVMFPNAPVDYTLFSATGLKIEHVRSERFMKSIGENFKCESLLELFTNKSLKSEGIELVKKAVLITSDVRKQVPYLSRNVCDNLARYTGVPEEIFYDKDVIRAMEEQFDTIISYIKNQHDSDDYIEAYSASLMSIHAKVERYGNRWDDWFIPVRVLHNCEKYYTPEFVKKYLFTRDTSKHRKFKHITAATAAKLFEYAYKADMTVDEQDYIIFMIKQSGINIAAIPKTSKLYALIGLSE